MNGYEYLSSQRFFHPKDPVESYARAAHIYFAYRKKEITVRSTIDCLIVQIALEHDLFLLHNDSDFIAMAPVIGPFTKNTQKLTQHTEI